MDDDDAWLAELFERGGDADRAKQLPAWALLFHSPFDRSGDATSWIGGAPKAPGNFEWAKDRDGTPLHFIAQIDLASLKPEPQTGLRPPGLPAEGALLVFIGKSWACRILSAAQMSQAKILPPPEDLAPVSKHGFFGEGRTFLRRPVTPTAFLDTGDDRPASLPDRFKSPLDWIVNWGIAALEAESVIRSLTFDLNDGLQFFAWRERLPQDQAREQDLKEVIRNKVAHYGVLERKAPSVIAALEAWRDLALSKSKDEAIDKDSLTAIMRLRLDLHDEMQPHMSKHMLAGRAEAVWDAIRLQYPRIDHGAGYAELPSCYRPFVDMRETGWRGHRLFGIEPAFENNWEDLRGQDCVISIAADALLQTKSEHEYGLSIWCPRDRIAKGLFDGGQLIRHCAV
ncbi:DUF1963 domain-containing protein [Bradyrhizobium sp. AUGA SZCCT0176]|uniref:DUF1963 domain-containing protein n=1 Tax=unclassified Bradyrhizobium TaxID=2631580 RepID=UPI001BA58264|nr:MULTISPECIES: DUF1963 domain-containing protein [unclassified Bradyrhizobium]MBR1229324.1 DUF1963 domain-containing protein [Bradyrhizobium sp. AUGA SZCCT0176]MBR1287463.1 DUF1963 domain-containing protein [Bradyrhizobium sp. AUGA SZCCT0177]